VFLIANKNENHDPAKTKAFITELHTKNYSMNTLTVVPMLVIP
jgi:hypothetical protein